MKLLRWLFRNPIPAAADLRRREELDELTTQVTATILRGKPVTERTNFSTTDCRYSGVRNVNGRR